MNMDFTFEKNEKGEIIAMYAKSYPYSLIGVFVKENEDVRKHSSFFSECTTAPYIVTHICSGRKGEALFDWDIEGKEEHKELCQLITEMINEAAIFLDKL